MQPCNCEPVVPQDGWGYIDFAFCIVFSCEIRNTFRTPCQEIKGVNWHGQKLGHGCGRVPRWEHVQGPKAVAVGPTRGHVLQVKWMRVSVGGESASLVIVWGEVVIKD